MNSLTRSYYRTLRREYRIARSTLMTNPNAFGRALYFNSLARELTGQFETGFCKPIPRVPYARRGCWQPTCTPTLSRFLAQ